MTQAEFNKAIVTELAALAHEVYRSTPSSNWYDLSGIRQRLDELQRHIEIAGLD